MKRPSLKVWVFLFFWVCLVTFEFEFALIPLPWVLGLSGLLSLGCGIGYFARSLKVQGKPRLTPGIFMLVSGLLLLGGGFLYLFAGWGTYPKQISNLDILLFVLSLPFIALIFGLLYFALPLKKDMNR